MGLKECVVRRAGFGPIADIAKLASVMHSQSSCYLAENDKFPDPTSYQFNSSNYFRKPSRKASFQNFHAPDLQEDMCGELTRTGLVMLEGSLIAKNIFH